MYVDGNIWHTMVLAAGGNHITADIKHGLCPPCRPRISKSNTVMLKSGLARRTFHCPPFGEEQPVQINRQELAHIKMRAWKISSNGFARDQTLRLRRPVSVGMVLTGGSSDLPGIWQLASQVLGLPVRTAKPDNLVGLVDKLSSPAYSTSVGLLQWAAAMQDEEMPAARSLAPPPERRGRMNMEPVKEWFKRLPYRRLLGSRNQEDHQPHHFRYSIR